ncbi:MAG: DUF1003 domain-containing protein [bacterium]
MKHQKPKERVCSICQKTVPSRNAVAGALVRDSIRNIILKEHPGWNPDGYICRDDLGRYRAEYVEDLLQSEKREVSALDQQVIKSLLEHEVVSQNLDREFEQTWTVGERLSDRLASFGGSWLFIMSFAAFLLIWIGLNTVVLVSRPVDPYPFILLNLVLSCIAAIQAPVIMMSQKRQEAKDRLRSQNDYKVNLKAELEIRHLHEKLDHLLSNQWERLVEVQEVQLELLEELERRRRR